MGFRALRLPRDARIGLQPEPRRNFRDLGFQAGSTSGESVSHAITKREVVLDSEFLDLPETTPKTGLTGFFLTPATGGFRDHIPGDWLAQHLVPPRSDVTNVLPRPEADQHFALGDRRHNAAGRGAAAETVFCGLNRSACAREVARR